jgi:uncharacterized protein
MPLSRLLVASLVLPGVLAFGTVRAHAASFDCRGVSLTAAQITVCGDQELSLADDRVARRVRDLQKRHGLGLYLGIRYWANRNIETRDACGNDRACLVTGYRAQQRMLEKLQTCLDGSIRKRSCLRVVIHNEDTAAQGGNQGGSQGGAPAGRARTH